MKTFKSGILGLGIVAMLFSCDTKEKALLQHKVDSLNVELQASNQVAEKNGRSGPHDRFH